MPEPRGQRLWAVLLVVDAFFVIIFGGALGAKLYQHWQGPTTAVPLRARKTVKAAVETPREVKENPKPAAVPEKTAPVAADKPARGKVIDIPQAQDSPRPPKPSILHEAPPRQVAILQGNGASSAATPARRRPCFCFKSPGAKPGIGRRLSRGGKSRCRLSPTT